MAGVQVNYNEAGQHHADWYIWPKTELGDWITLRAADGGWTGHLLHRSQLVYTAEEKARAARGWSGKKDGFPEIDGFLRLDYHERVRMTPESGVPGSAVFHRGGSGYKDSFGTKYGHIMLSDLDDWKYELDAPFPSGGNRGAPAEDATDYRAGLYAVRCREMRGLLYKGRQEDGSIPWGSLCQTYSDMGDAWGGDLHYKPICWSWLNVGGGGMVRSVLREGARVRQCQVPRVKSPIWAVDEAAGSISAVGEWAAQYVRPSNHRPGWMVVAHKTIYTGPDWIYHLEKVG